MMFGMKAKIARLQSETEAARRDATAVRDELNKLKSTLASRQVIPSDLSGYPYLSLIPRPLTFPISLPVLQKQINALAEASGLTWYPEAMKPAHFAKNGGPENATPAPPPSEG